LDEAEEFLRNCFTNHVKFMRSMKKKAESSQDTPQKVLLKLKKERDSLEKLAGILLERESIAGGKLNPCAEEVGIRAIAAREEAQIDALH